jgi:hypothetical protein
MDHNQLQSLPSVPTAPSRRPITLTESNAFKARTQMEEDPPHRSPPWANEVNRTAPPSQWHWLWDNEDDEWHWEWLERPGLQPPPSSSSSACDACMAPSPHTTYWERTTTWTYPRDDEQEWRDSANRSWYDWGDRSTRDREAKQTVVWKEVATFAPQQPGPSTRPVPRVEASPGLMAVLPSPSLLLEQPPADRTIWPAPPGLALPAPPGLGPPQTGGSQPTRNLATYDDGLSKALAKILRYDIPPMDMEGFIAISDVQGILRRRYSIDEIRTVARFSLNRDHRHRFQLNITGLKIKAVFFTASTRPHHRRNHH